MGWEAKMERARRLHRPSLKNWQRDQMYERFPDYQQRLQDSDHSDLVCAFINTTQSIPVRVEAKNLSTEAFTKEFHATGTPCVINNIPTVENWPAVQRWTLQALSADQDLVERVFKCGEDDEGRSIKVKLRHFLQYLDHNRDDSPLYVFDTAFDEDRLARRILKDYQVPSYFKNDLFRYVSEKRRPPYRWFLVGPERSGTTVHIDPLGTAAWNTLLVGKKRWVLFPPHVPKPVVKGKGLISKHEDDEAIHYFTFILPRIRQHAKERCAAGDPAYQSFACYEFTQHAGETVFVPTGWWHAVLNVTHTVGCTQNFCAPTNFDAVWCQTRSGRKKMAWKWLQQLRIHEPSLYRRAVELNVRDGFIMKYDPNNGQLPSSSSCDDTSQNHDGTGPQAKKGSKRVLEPGAALEFHRLKSAKDWEPNQWKALNRAAESTAQKGAQADMPLLDILTRSDYQAVYEPAEDTYLLLDALLHDFCRGVFDTNMTIAGGARGDFVVLEIGCGTGVPTVWFRREWSKRYPGRPLRTFVTDINPHALKVAQRLDQRNNGDSGLLPIEPFRCDLATDLLERLAGSVDVLIFNPPYVVTPDDEVVDFSKDENCITENSIIAAAWAGGTHGRRIVDRALPQIQRLLRGQGYLVTVDDNQPWEMAELCAKCYNLRLLPLLRRRAHNEFLTIQKLLPSHGTSRPETY